MELFRCSPKMKHSSYDPIRTDGSAIRSKGLTNIKMSQKWFRVHYLELFAADTRLFQVKPPFSKKWVAPIEEAQLIWVDSNRWVWFLSLKRERFIWNIGNLEMYSETVTGIKYSARRFLLNLWQTLFNANKLTNSKSVK